MVKFEKVYFSFQAFGIFDFKDTTYLMLLHFETITAQTSQGKWAYVDGMFDH